MTHEDIRAQLLRTAAFYPLGRFDQVARFADEAARTIAQALAGERDAAVAAEREACARVADAEHDEDAALAATSTGAVRTYHEERSLVAARIGDEIRARAPAPAPSASGSERDAAVRALLDAATHCVQESDAHQREYADAAARVRALFPEGK